MLPKPYSADGALTPELQAIAVTAHDRLKADWRQPEGLLPSLRDGGGRSLYVRNEGECVPRIIVMAERPTDTLMLSERIGVADLDSEHFRAQLLERLSWAVGDAHVAEHADREE